MDKQGFVMIFHQLLGRRLFLGMLGKLAVLIGIGGNQPSFALPLQQPLTKVGYGQGSYGQGEYPALVESHAYMPIIIKKEN